MTTTARLIFPHQLFLEQLNVPKDTLCVLVEDDLFFRQYAFHAQKLVLHRASMTAFADRLEAAGSAVRHIRSSSEVSSFAALAAVLREEGVSSFSVFDVVDDWLGQRIVSLAAELGIDFGRADVPESPNFLTTRDEFNSYFDQHGARQHGFYMWQRKRLNILLEADGTPVGGKWSFDADNRKKLPKGYTPPPVNWPEPCPYVAAAIAQIRGEFPNAPGIDHIEQFRYPITHEAAAAGLDDFLTNRFADFGPYEDAISTCHAEINHSLLTPSLNIGLLNPREVIERALAVGGNGAGTEAGADAEAVPIASLEGFIRQVIGWREYMRATYSRWGTHMRTQNVLNHTNSLHSGWWDGSVGLEPVDHVIGNVLATGYAHHIERLMVLGNAMCLMRVHPDEVYEWFMALFIDAYDWVMVPNVYAMSQFACGDFITTKPYVSGSNYLKKMSDFGVGAWRDEWNSLYWAFIHDHRPVFESNHRSKMVVSLWDRMDEVTQQQHLRNVAPWLGRT